MEISVNFMTQVIQFLGDARQVHSLYCASEDGAGRWTTTSTAHIQRISQGKRTANDICQWFYFRIFT
jgi:hypothetical protein